MEDPEERKIKSYEYRGNQPACRLLVTTNILLWVVSAICAAYPVRDKISKFGLPIIFPALIALFFLGNSN
jgi:hypothetical protein